MTHPAIPLIPLIPHFPAYSEPSTPVSQCITFSTNCGFREPAGVFMPMGSRWGAGALGREHRGLAIEWTRPWWAGPAGTV